MRNAPSNTDDTIDSRDVIERIEELENERAEYDDSDEETERDIEANQSLRDAWDEQNGEELKALLALQESAGRYSDWNHGAQLIRDSYFETYARELADDLGAVDRNGRWPTTCIDWKQAAEELQSDYTSVEFDGVAYWVR